MQLSTAQALAEKLLAQHGLTASGWVVVFDNAKRRFGQCDASKKQISLSRPLVRLNDAATVRLTILHEIAHALAGVRHGHDRVWKAKAREIGADPTRCYDSEKVATPPAPIIGSCPNGHPAKRHRRPSSPVSCTRCCPTFNPTYLFAWKKADGKPLPPLPQYDRALDRLRAKYGDVLHV